MAQCRAQNADCVGQDNGIDRLADLLTRLVNQPPPQAPQREVFEPPTFDGTSDAECFIRQFQDVSLANKWTDDAAPLHIRAKLKRDTRDCGRADTLQSVYTSLRACFGMTRREARARLAGLKRSSWTTLQAHTTEVERLVQLAYEELPDQHRSDMAIEMFCSSLGHLQLQRHLLAIPLPDLQTAVRAENDYLQIQPANTPMDIRAVTQDSDPTTSKTVTQVATDPLQMLLKAVQDLTLEVSKLKKATS